MKRYQAILFVWVSAFLATGSAQGQEPIPTDQSFHDHVVIVLDASGSMKQMMRGTEVMKMNAAKEALKAVLDQVSPDTHIGLLVFSATNVTDHWVYPPGPRDEADLIKAIDLPQPRRGTPLGEYIKIGADRLLEARQAQYGYGTYRLLVVTDGEATDPRLVDQYAPEVHSRGISKDVIGVDMDQDHTLATMAHSYRKANDPESLKQAVQEVFAELSSESADFSMDEAFELIAPIPAEAAAAALQALATSGNEPIGQQDNRPAKSSDFTTSTPPSASVPASPIKSSAEESWSELLKIGVLGAIILLVILTRKSSKR